MPATTASGVAVVRQAGAGKNRARPAPRARRFRHHVYTARRWELLVQVIGRGNGRVDHLPGFHRHAKLPGARRTCSCCACRCWWQRPPACPDRQRKEGGISSSGWLSRHSTPSMSRIMPLMFGEVVCGWPFQEPFCEKRPDSVRCRHPAFCLSCDHCSISAA
jgi:hypothetical protein